MEIPKPLIDRIKNGNIVLFVGAGLSKSAGLPDWKELTIAILNSIKDKEKKAEGFIDALKNDLFEPIDILKKIEHLKKNAIESLENEIRQFDNIKPTSVHKKLAEISTRIITTNYDELIEKSYNGYEKITYHNSYKVSKISEYEKYIFKIHGDINEPDKCILFPSEYKSLYSEDEKCPIFELKKIFSDKSILFIGFGLNDPYINYVKNYIHKLYSGFTPEHFVVTTENKKDWGERINPIILENYSQMEEFIDKLIEYKSINDSIEKTKKLKEEVDDEVILSSEYLEYDIPPNVKYWVGRDRELNNISNESFRVIFITGIGGQGKSALASHFIKNYFDTETYEFGDWRDFKEETNRFQTKIISIIKRLSKGDFNVKKLETLDNKELVDTFFYYLDKRRIVFVFDNVDSYIDLASFKPTGGIGYLFEQTLKREHNSRFIFTCRPFIKEAGVNFYQISLEGLTLPESIELFKNYKIPANEEKLQEFCKKTHSITKGHPLWLNLIAAQAIRGLDTANKFIDNIKNRSSFNEEDFSSILSQKVLNQVWDSLTPKQQNLLRGIAETVKPETKNNLKQILKTEISNNQFERAFKTLKNLHLIETKSSSISEDQIELHPLVKEFIISKYPRIERAKFITLLVKYYDSYIFILKPKLSASLSLSAFQNWTSKIELEINKGDFIPALIALHEVSISILAAGFAEEYIRVAERLFDSINWSEAIDKEYAYFHQQFNTFITTLTQYGSFIKSENYLDKYQKLIPGKSSHYLVFCSAKCYLFWYQEDFERAILIGEEGEFLLSNSGFKDNHSLKHNLALARRDSKIKENLSKALIYFLNGEDLESILNKEKVKIELGGTFYGNVGRCLYFMDDIDNALKCYYYSLFILLEQEDEDTKLNQGYAYYWISEILLSKGNLQDGLYFHKCAINTWVNISPPRALKLKDIWNKINADVDTKKQIDNKADWQIEKYCKQKLDSYLKSVAFKIEA